MSRFAERRERLCRKFRAGHIDALLVTNFTNVTYLSGFTGDDSFLIVSREGAVMVSDSRFEEQLAVECSDLRVEIRRTGQTMADRVASIVRVMKLHRLGVEATSMSLALHGALQERLPSTRLVATHGLVEQLREVKDKEEIAAIREAVHFAERAFGVVRASLVGSQTEKEVADEIELQLRRFGARGSSFEPIVAVGSNAALPHAQPGQRRIDANPLLLIDWGARGRCYNSDLTRVLATDKIPAKLQRVYGVVLRAQQAAIDVIRPGVPAEEVDRAARSVIAEAGLGRYFGHSLGHGIGLEVHEGPRLAQNQPQPLKAGMVVTVEPGVYLPGLGGVRIEDDVLVTRQGCELLSRLRKDWDSIHTVL